MSPLNAYQLIQRIQIDPVVHGEFLNYVRATDPALIGLPDPQAHLRIGQEMANNTTQYWAWLYAFLPQYNATHPDSAPVPTPTTGTGPDLVSRIGDFFGKHKTFSKAAGTGIKVFALGLAGVVGSSFLDEGTGKQILQYASNGALVASPVVIVIKYLNLKGK